MKRSRQIFIVTGQILYADILSLQVNIIVSTVYMYMWYVVHVTRHEV